MMAEKEEEVKNVVFKFYSPALCVGKDAQGIKILGEFRLGILGPAKERALSLNLALCIIYLES